MAEVLTGVHRIASAYQGRLLTSYLLQGARTVLIDSGFPHTAHEIIVPYLGSIGVRQLDWLVITHASGDHFGGNDALKRYSPAVKILAHERDADSIEHHQIFVSEHVTAFQNKGVPIPNMDPDSSDFVRLHGPQVPVDYRVQTVSRIDLGNDWYCSLIHAPGHTPGHLIIFDHLHQALISGDSLMGHGIPNLDGNLDMPPHYFDVQWYLQTISLARELEPKYLFATHYSPCHGAEVKQFLDESENFVRWFETQLMAVLAASHRPMGVTELINVSRRIVGIPDATYQYGMLALAHLNELALRGVVEVENGDKGPRWILHDR